MADNVPITAGAGTTVATDDVAGVHFQRVKLVDGTLDSSAAIPGDAANGLDVDVTRLPSLPAGTNAIGKLAANSGVDIGDVDVTSLPALAAGTNLIGKVGIDQVTANANEVVVKSALPAGTNAIGKLAANSGVDIGDVDVTSLPALPTGTNTIGAVTKATQTADGCTPFSRLSTNDDNAAVVKASAGCLYFGYSTNTNNGAARYLKLYDKATAPLSSDTPIQRYLLPGNSAGAGGAQMFPHPIAFANGLGIRITTGAADNDTGAPAANEVIVNLGYK